MLQDIWVHNFRSLEDFGLHIEPGLNVLVGPNGAGKTSIMKWFEFLSLLSNSSLRESIGKVGGANHVFRRKDEKYSDTLSFRFQGRTVVMNEFYYPEKDRVDYLIDYSYDGEISVIKNQIFFSKQNTKVWIHPKKINSEITNSTPNIDIKWSYDALTDEIKCDINNKKPKSMSKDRVENYYFNENNVLQDILKGRQSLEHLILPHKFFPIDFLYAIKEDINFKKAFNINPSSVRSAADISLQPGVQYDGAGLVSTLYNIKLEKSNATINRYQIGRTQHPKAPTYGKVLSYFKLSDSNIQNIDATIDNFRNEFNVEVEFSTAHLPYKIPVFLLSDGTLKWLAIVTALATEEHSLFIEEPENFLHPRLQENIVEILREELSSSPEPRFAFITTHSETLLNKLMPEEIILTSMIDGKTVSQRVENPQEISVIISESGFGLGYFYVSGGF
ncbi:AAA family ATPase [Shinella sp.]|uniref:AAA family ATPase n=1 Tax=Shinella sp. TaxID=1870904 RepID=UPI003F6F9730